MNGSFVEVKVKVKQEESHNVEDSTEDLIDMTTSRRNENSDYNIQYAFHFGPGNLPLLRHQFLRCFEHKY